jgi:hypothetical protein
MWPVDILCFLQASGNRFVRLIQRTQKNRARIISLYIVQDFGNVLLRTVISNIKRACGCTVFELDKKEYALIEEDTIKVTYAAGKATDSLR